MHLPPALSSATSHWPKGVPFTPRNRQMRPSGTFSLEPLFQHSTAGRVRFPGGGFNHLRQVPEKVPEGVVGRSPCGPGRMGRPNWRLHPSCSGPSGGVTHVPILAIAGRLAASSCQGARLPFGEASACLSETGLVDWSRRRPDACSPSHGPARGPAICRAPPRGLGGLLLPGLPPTAACAPGNSLPSPREGQGRYPKSFPPFPLCTDPPPSVAGFGDRL